MSDVLFEASVSYYNLAKRMEDYSFVWWSTRFKLNAGDTVFMYVGDPVSQVLYRFRVAEDGTLPDNDSVYYANPHDYYEDSQNHQVKLVLMSKNPKLDTSYKTLVGIAPHLRVNWQRHLEGPKLEVLANYLRNCFLP